MRIGIDARALSNAGGGEATHVSNLVRALNIVSPDDEYTLLLHPSPPAVSIPSAENLQHMAIWPRNRMVRLLATVPIALTRVRLDVVHFQNAVPLYCPAPSVITVHDIGYERYPHFFIAEEVKRLRVLMPLMVRRAARILTGSEYSKQDIVRRYRVAPDKIVVAPYAADPMFEPLHDPQSLVDVRERYNTGAHFILCVSSIQPRKNIKALINAYVRLRRAGAISQRLVLVGSKAWRYDDTFAAAQDSGYVDDLIFTDHVPDDDLVALYNAADVFVYPSLFEGFGLPALEAMRCGTPVITSNTTSLPEVVGDAALTVDPLDVEALAQAVASVVNSPELRRRLAQQSLRRAACFSWEATARSVSQVYHTVGAS